MKRFGDHVVCIGEILWDSLPDGIFLGGAPFNVAYHLHALGAKSELASCVGADALGGVIVRRMEEKGLPGGLLQTESEAPTGLVHVNLDGSGNATYEIVAPAAWDYIRLTPGLREAAAGADAIVFGSLAQRSDVSRQTIRALLGGDALKVFDVNLRPPFDDRQIVEHGLRSADVVKLNDEEFARLAGWFGVPFDLEAGAAALARMFDVLAVCVTRGPRGAVLWHAGSFSAHPGFAVQVRDTVGSGDAFLAALVRGLLGKTPDAEILERANAAGAYVATQNGATPAIDESQVSLIASASAGGR